MSLFFNAPLSFIASGGGGGVSYGVGTGGDNSYQATIDGQLYQFREFTSNGTFNVTTQGVFDVLLVGGGGGGGTGIGGGGGGGEVILAQFIEIGTGTFTVNIGNGGQGSTGHFPANSGTNGGSTSFTGSGFTTITSKGGAFGASYRTNAGSGGGNGGGGARTFGQRSIGTSTSIASGTHGSLSTYTIYSGYVGVNGNETKLKGGGGGGANGNGQGGFAAATNAGAVGGAGIQILNFDQYSYYYGGGGGGATYYSADVGGNGGIGGGGGGGAGGDGGSGGAGGTGDTNGRNAGGDGDVGYDTGDGGNGGTNTGGGGGSASWSEPQGGAGGSGIVVIRYAI